MSHGRRDRAGASPGILLQHPLSFSSQIVRLAAAEAGVSLVLVDIDIGPGHQNYAPWYFAVNPMAVVPTLLHGDRVITDCLRISRYLDETGGGSTLTPAEPGARRTADRWVDRQQAVPERELSYGLAGGIAGRLARIELHHRRRLLRRTRRRNPGLAAHYDAKLRDLERWQYRVTDAAARQTIVDAAIQTLSDLERHLADRPFIAGDRYSLADVVWTVFLARVTMLGMDHWLASTERPHLAAYFECMMRRPSFAAACVYRRLPRGFLLRSLLEAHGRNLAIVSLALSTALLLA